MLFTILPSLLFGVMPTHNNTRQSHGVNVAVVLAQIIDAVVKVTKHVSANATGTSFTVCMHAAASAAVALFTCRKVCCSALQYIT